MWKKKTEIKMNRINKSQMKHKNSRLSKVLHKFVKLNCEHFICYSNLIDRLIDWCCTHNINMWIAPVNFESFEKMAIASVHLTIQFIKRIKKGSIFDHFASSRFEWAVRSAHTGANVFLQNKIACGIWTGGRTCMRLCAINCRTILILNFAMLGEIKSKINNILIANERRRRWQWQLRLMWNKSFHIC